MIFHSRIRSGDFQKFGGPGLDRDWKISQSAHPWFAHGVKWEISQVRHIVWHRQLGKVQKNTKVRFWPI